MNSDVRKVTAIGKAVLDAIDNVSERIEFSEGHALQALAQVIYKIAKGSEDFPGADGLAEQFRLTVMDLEAIDRKAS